MAAVAIPKRDELEQEKIDRREQLIELFKRRDDAIKAGLEVWTIDQINADVAERRGQDRSL